jgi:kanamycin kinase
MTDSLPGGDNRPVTTPLPDRHQPPESVRPLLEGRPWRLVWRNELGGLTYEVPGSVFVKWFPPGVGLDLSLEAAKLRWAAAYTPVPEVVDAGDDWLRTVALQGESAVSARWKADPLRAVRAIGEGLRAMHDALPVDSCPWTWAAEDRFRRAVASQGGGPPATHWHPEHRAIPLTDGLARLADVPDVDRFVVCHGDPCAPNTLLADDGRWTAHVDLAALGVADRWADLAVATWSTTWNYGPGYEQALLDAYGIALDPERTAYYRLLWDLTP